MPNRFHPIRLAACLSTFLTIVASGGAASVFADPPLGWVEEFSDDPLLGGRFHMPALHDPARFSYDEPQARLTVHYDSFEPTAWYVRPIDPAGNIPVTDCDNFEFSVTFRIKSAGFFADPNAFAQIGWGLVNSATTGDDRSGGSAGPFAFDCVGFDYFPNVSPDFGGPTLAAAAIHSNEGQGFFSAIEFPFGDESSIDTNSGEQGIALDAVYTGRVVYSGISRTAVLTVHDGTALVPINAEGGGGAGGPDTDVATIQTQLFSPGPFRVDSFALTAWEDTFNFGASTVVADVDIVRVSVSATVSPLGDVNRDGVVDGRDIQPFTDLLLGASAEVCASRRADFSGDGLVTSQDIAGFESALIDD